MSVGCTQELGESECFREPIVEKLSSFREPSYSYTLSQFYLDVLGRNGAWVDDVFKVKGSRVALGP